MWASITLGNAHPHGAVVVLGRERGGLRWYDALWPIADCGIWAGGVVRRRGRVSSLAICTPAANGGARPYIMQERGGVNVAPLDRVGNMVG